MENVCSLDGNVTFKVRPVRVGNVEQAVGEEPRPGTETVVSPGGGSLIGMSQSCVWPGHRSAAARRSPVLLSSLTEVVTASLCFSDRRC